MKQLLAKLTFKDAPAQGAWFAITLWGLGLYVMFSLLLGAMASGGVTLSNHKALTMAMQQSSLILSVYLGLMLFHFYDQSTRGTRCRSWFWLLLWLYILIAAAPVAYGWVTGTVIITVIFGGWLFPLLLIGKIRRYDYFAHALCWTGAAAGIMITAAAPISEYRFWFTSPPVSYLQTGIQSLVCGRLADNVWIFLSLLSVLLLLAAYLLTAKIFGDAFAVPFRNMFGKGVLTLWGLALATYLTFLGMAVTVSHQAANNVKALEQRFGRPLTAEALGKLYAGSDRPDPDFWAAIEKYAKNCDAKSDAAKFDYTPVAVPPPALAEWRQKFAGLNPDLAQWEQAFSNVIPLDEHQFTAGNLMNMSLPHLKLYRQFSRLEWWRIRFALADNDVPGALAAYRRMGIADNSLSRESCLLGGLVWIACQNIRLDALQLLLESGKLPSDQLQSLSADLQAVAKQVPEIQERSLYSEAVFGMDIFDMLGRGRQAFGNSPQAPPFQSLRFLLPQLWWYAAKDKADLAKHYNVKNFNEIIEPEYPPNAILLSRSLLGGLQAASIRFDGITARLRAAEVIIRAIEYQRQHGSYPKTLDNLPLDPFNGKPMQYRVGDCEIERSVAVPQSRKRQRETVTETVPAIICWSVGRNLVNDNGKRQCDGGAMPDDISFMIQTKP